MSNRDRLTLHTRERLRSSIEATLIAAQAVRPSADQLAAELQSDVEELALSVAFLCFRGAYGEGMAKVILEDLTGRLSESDAEVAKRLGTTPQAVSKILIRVRRNLGFPPRVPNNANGAILGSMKKARIRVGGGN
jgi:hypothetical protein